MGAREINISPETPAALPVYLSQSGLEGKP